MGGATPDFNGFRRIVQGLDAIAIGVDTGQGQGYQRVVYLSGSHPPRHIRLRHGDSRGRFEGETLVVESQAMFCFDPTSLLEVDIDPDRAMVGAAFVGPDKCLMYAPHCSRRCEDVVDSPSDVPLARTAPLPPPRVLVRRLGMQSAKGIHPARVEPVVELRPLLGEEPAVGDIRLRACKVDRVVRRVVVADHEHRAPTPQRLRSGEDCPREVELVADPTVVTGRAASLGEVAVDHHEPPTGGLEVPSHEPPLSVEPRYAQGGFHPDGLRLPSLSGGSGIPHVYTPLFKRSYQTTRSDGRRPTGQDGERIWPRPAVARTGSDDHVGEDARTASLKAGIRVPSSGPGGERVLPIQAHHRRWPSRPESNLAGE